MATRVRRNSLKTQVEGPEPSVVDLLVDDSLASREIETLFIERGIPHRLSRVAGLDHDRPAVYLEEGPAGTFFYGPGEISFYFLSRYDDARNGG